MKKFTFYEVKIEEIEPGIVVTDYGSQLVTPVLLADLLDRLAREWGDTKIAMLTIAPSATEMGKFTSVVEEKNASGFIIASAVLASNQLQRELIRVVHGQKQTAHPRRIFEDKEEAIAWLREELHGR
ncbi:aldehyde ferredoxin oxidoreductase [Tepidicaulis marinus]|jgi:hypothetical protein|uniref:Aldehyde ferredoxin oxidoreductase n=1 Tax=Tepidicaulis marinus TaxID=1333998 RepID=A0A081B8B3_9HYPH|nr:hypothetical protein [Tepidicaulis marinus]GAK44281.1 aldehyde ferredoxin oxidoreductase [Tepidicaulis marinus]